MSPNPGLHIESTVKLSMLNLKSSFFGAKLEFVFVLKRRLSNRHDGVCYSKREHKLLGSTEQIDRLIHIVGLAYIHIP